MRVEGARTLRRGWAVRPTKFLSPSIRTASPTILGSPAGAAGVAGVAGAGAWAASTAADPAAAGAVPAGVASVTVVHPDLVWADLDATAAFALDGEATAWLTARDRTGLVVHAAGRRELVGSHD